MPYTVYHIAMMTKDAVTVTVDAISFMKVTDPIRAILEVDDYRKAFNSFAATTLRSVIGTYDMEQLLSNRDEINGKAQSTIEQETSSWGVAVPAVEIKDVRLPKNMQRAMAAEAESERERRAKVVSSMGEAEAAEQLAKAADVIADSPGALQLRYLHTLVKISAEKNSTILVYALYLVYRPIFITIIMTDFICLFMKQFPLPMEVMRGMQAFSDHHVNQQVARRRKAVEDEQKEQEM